MTQTEHPTLSPRQESPLLNAVHGLQQQLLAGDGPEKLYPAMLTAWKISCHGRAAMLYRMPPGQTSLELVARLGECEGSETPDEFARDLMERKQPCLKKWPGPGAELMLGVPLQAAGAEWALVAAPCNPQSHGQESLFEALAPLASTCAVMLEALAQRQNAMQTEAYTHQMAESFRLAFHSPLIGKAVLSSQGDWLAVNGELCNLLGYDEAELLSRSCWDITLPEDHAHCREVLAQLISGELNQVTLSKRYIHKDGHPIKFHLHVGAVRSRQGQVQSLILHVLDASRQEALELRALEAEQCFRRGFEEAAIGMCLVSTEMKFLRVNPTFCQMLGYKASELTGRHFNEFSPAEDVEQSLPRIQQIQNDPATRLIFEKRLIHKEGRHICCRLSCSAVVDEQDAIQYFVTQIIDITQEKKVFEQLQESEQRFRLAFDNAPIGMALVSTEGRCIRVNARICEMFGYTEAEMLHKHFNDVTHPDEHEKGLQLLEQLMNREIDGFMAEKTYLHKTGEPVRVRLHVSAIRDETGTPLYFVSQVMDISEQNRMMEALRESEERFRAMAEFAPVMIYLTEGAEVMYYNKAYREFYGLQPHEVPHFNWQERIHPDDLDYCLAAGQKLAPTEIEIRVRRVDGEWRWLLVSIVPRVFADKQPLGFIGISIDITERKEMENALRKSESFFRSAFDDAAIGMAVVGADLKYLKVNSRLCEMTGFSPEELQAMTVPELTHPDDRAEDAVCVQKIINNETDRFMREKRYICKDGRIIWVVLSTSVVRDKEGTLQYFVSQMQDITARKQMLEVLRESEERFRNSFDYAAIGKALVSSDGRFLKVNRALCDLTGYPEAELLNLTFQQITHPDDLDRDLRLYDDLKAGHINSYQMEKRYLHKRGHYIWILLNVSLVHDADGLPLYAIAEIHDITDRKRSEATLRQAKDQAESIARLKSEFLSTMSHEMRTPMNAILGLSALLEETPLSPEQQGMVETIRTSSMGLLSVINEILELSKVESGKAQSREQLFDLRACIDSIVKLLGVKAAEKNIGLSYEIAPDVPGHILSDPNWLRQILVNLVGNAIKFTHQGTVSVGVIARPGQAPNGLNLHFAVQDTGCGIPQDKLSEIFKVFTRVDSEPFSPVEGTGLGLSICERLIQQLGGEIRVESELNRGSTFYFHIPVKVPGEPFEEPGPAAPASPRLLSDLASRIPLKILVTEDNDANRKLIKHILDKLGYEPALARDGQEALELLTRAASENQPFELVFMDIQMPKLNGLETTQHILRDIETSLRPRIVAMTAMVGPDDRQKCMDAGMDDFLGKPLGIEDLQNIILKWFGQPEDAPRRPPAGKPEPASPWTASCCSPASSMTKPCFKN